LNNGKARESAVSFFKSQFAALARSDADLNYFLKNGLDFDRDNNDRLFAIINKLANRTIAETLAQGGEVSSESDFTKIYLHTIGPMSICGALLGKWMQIPDVIHGRKRTPF
jgi:hypothetical protein